MAFLELRNVVKRFGTTTAVDSFNLAADKGEMVAFLGPSGCGKTTTLRMIAGFEMPDDGTIVVDGTDITYRPASKRKLGMVFQSYALFPNMTVADNIAFGMRMTRQPANRIKSQVDAMLQLIDMQSFAARYPHQLSGGQQQRVALARAIAIEPQVLLLDEPLSALDARIRMTLRQEIRAIQRRLGITTIFVTHDQEEALSIADRVVVMNRGQIEQVGTPFEIYNMPRTRFVASFIGTLNLLEAKVDDPWQGTLTIGDGVLRTSAPLANHPVGETVTLAIRPEAISIAEGDDPNGIDGQVADIMFLGAVVRMRLQVGAHTLAFDTFNHPHLALPQIGEHVRVRVPPEACMVIEGATASASVLTEA